VRPFGRIVVVIVAMLGLGEVVTRQWLTSPSGQDFDAELGWVWRPGAHILNASEGGADIRVNERGLIDDPLTPKNGRTRILGFGNSFMEALQVPIAHNYTSLVERKVADVDVVNLARSGMGPGHYPTVLRRFAALEPDSLLVSVGYGDLDDVMAPNVNVERDAAGGIHRLWLTVDAKDRLKRVFAPIITRSALATYLMRRFKPVVMGWRAAWRELKGAPDPQPATAPLDYRAAEERLSFVLRRLQTSAPVVVLDIPHIVYRAEGASLGAPEEVAVFRRAARAAGVDYLDAGPALISAYARTRQPLHGFANLKIGSGHLNEAGHAVVADVVSRWLLQQRAGAGSHTAKPNATKPNMAE
jgi:hypothetical protein